MAKSRTDSDFLKKRADYLLRRWGNYLKQGNRFNELGYPTGSSFSYADTGSYANNELDFDDVSERVNQVVFSLPCQYVLVSHNYYVKNQTVRLVCAHTGFTRSVVMSMLMVIRGAVYSAMD